MKTSPLTLSFALLAATFFLLCSAEDMKFTYQLGPVQNICFLQNIAENIQGKLITYNTIHSLIWSPLSSILPHENY